MSTLGIISSVFIINIWLWKQEGICLAFIHNKSVIVPFWSLQRGLRLCLKESKRQVISGDGLSLPEFFDDLLHQKLFQDIRVIFQYSRYGYSWMNSSKLFPGLMWIFKKNFKIVCIKTLSNNCSIYTLYYNNDFWMRDVQI